MITLTTPRILMSRWLRDKACEVLGIDYRAVNEWKLGADELIKMTESEGIAIWYIIEIPFYG